MYDTGKACLIEKAFASKTRIPLSCHEKSGDVKVFISFGAALDISEVDRTRTFGKSKTQKSSLWKMLYFTAPNFWTKICKNLHVYMVCKLHTPLQDSQIGKIGKYWSLGLVKLIKYRLYMLWFTLWYLGSLGIIILLDQLTLRQSELGVNDLPDTFCSQSLRPRSPM